MIGALPLIEGETAMSATLSPKTLKLDLPGDGGAAAKTAQAAAVTFEVEDQSADTINNVGGDQYNNRHYELVIEPMRRRARVLLRLGNALVLSALAAQLTVMALFGSKIGDFVNSIGPAIDARSVDAVAWPDAGVLVAIPIAAVVGFVGLLLVLTSVSMRRRARREAEAL
jgi:hypothetical protein